MVIIIYDNAFFLYFFLLQCVGTDRNIPDSVLQNRANTLYNILVTFHFNITEILDRSLLRWAVVLKNYRNQTTTVELIN